jgi:hypothetical protein
VGEHPPAGREEEGGGEEARPRVFVGAREGERVGKGNASFIIRGR